MSEIATLGKPVFNILTVHSPKAEEIIRINPEGRIFWRGREVETDNEFRGVMLELAHHFMGVKK